jgi:hypothetical protein
VHVAATRLDADLVVSMLQAHEVRAFAAGTGAEQWTEAGNLGTFARVPGPLNSIRVLVHPDDEDDARALLHDDSEPDADEDLEVAGSESWRLSPPRYTRVRRALAWYLLIGILLGGPAVAGVVYIVGALTDS